MNRKNRWNLVIFLGIFLIFQSVLANNITAYCLHREGATIEIPPDTDTWVEECCDDRPSHWPASAMPVPVFIYSATPDEFMASIYNAVDSWNSIESSTFEMQIIGTFPFKISIPGAVVIGFDPDYCTDGKPCPLAASGCAATSIDSSWDGYQIQQCTIFADADAYDWDQPGLDNPDSQMVMTHELGHVLGLMHPGFNPHGRGGAGCGPEFDGATMACCGGQIDASSLELDDMAAATSLYPKWKYIVKVLDKTNNPIANAAVWMDNTCFPHEGLDRFEGGMVFGDIGFCLTGDSEASGTYYPGFTYVTESDGQTGAFRVMHSNFCFTVVADGFADLYACQNLSAPGNYLRTVIMNMPPVALCSDSTVIADQNCEGDASVDNGSYDPDGDPITVTEIPASPYQLGSTQVTLTVTDSSGATDMCQGEVTVVDTTPPVIDCPVDITIECDQSAEPAHTGEPTVSDACSPNLTPVYSDSVTGDMCGVQSIERLWTATDSSGNQNSCVQNINVVDTTAPVISCNSPATITPKDAPITFTTTAEDNCDEEPLVQINAYTCTFVAPNDKKINRDQSCTVSFIDDTLTIDDSGGINDLISWTVQATDCAGNQTSKECFIDVVKYGNQQ